MSGLSVAILQVTVGYYTKQADYVNVYLYSRHSRPINNLRRLHITLCFMGALRSHLVRPSVRPQAGESILIRQTTDDDIRRRLML